MRPPYTMDEFTLKEIIEEHTEEALTAQLKHREIEGAIDRWMKGEEVVVLTGVRRSGKTSIMFNLLQRHGGTYINFEDERLMDFTIRDFEKLERLTKGPLFLDEVQHVPGWERFVRRIHRRRKVVVSGSNASLLEGEFASSLTGRTITFHIYPLTYREFLFFKGLKPGRASFSKYLELGGFPAVVLKEERRLLKEYFSAILYRDIRGLNDAMERLAFFLLSNVGKPFTYRSLKAYLGVKHELTVKRYIRALEKAFLIHILHRYDPSLRRQESYEKKVYAADHGLASLFPRVRDAGRLLENATLLNLLPWGKELYFYKNGGEVDFLIAEGLKVEMALNVTYELSEVNLRREVKPLKKWGGQGVEARLLYLYSTLGDMGALAMPIYTFLSQPTAPPPTPLSL